MKELGLLDCRSRGLPARRYIKIFEKAILKMLGADEIIETEQPKKPAKEETKSNKKVSRKDQLTEYVNGLDFNDETKKALFDWIFQIGLPRGITVEQLACKLSDLDKSCNGAEELMHQAIKNSYLNNWFGFFKPNNNNKAPVKDTATEYYKNVIRDGRNVKLGAEVF